MSESMETSPSGELPEVRLHHLHEGSRHSFFLLTIGLATAVFVILDMLGTLYRQMPGESLALSRFAADSLLVGCSFCGVLAMRLFAHHLSTSRGMNALFITAFVGTVAAPLLLDTPFTWLGLIVSGLGMVALVFLWWSHACTMDRSVLTRVLVVAIFSAALGLIITTFVSHSIIPNDYIREAAAITSCLFLLAVENKKRNELLQVSIEESRARRRDRAYSRIGELNYFSVGVLLGCDGALWLPFSDAGYASFLPSPTLLFGFALLLAGAVAMVGRSNEMFSLERVSKDYLSFTLAIGYLLVPFVGAGMLTAVYVYLIALALIQLVIIFLAGAELVRFEQLSPLYSFTETLYIAAGVLIGTAFVWAATWLAPDMALPLSCGATLLYIIFVQVQLNKITFPEDWTEDEEMLAAHCPAFEKLLRLDVSELPIGSSAEIDVRPSAEDGEAESPDDRLIPAGSFLRRRLDDIARSYKLSPRQTEILYLLARGRDTQYIMDSFTISRATAKTHVYNIYRKLDIHSRQDLYDMIEMDEPRD